MAKPTPYVKLSQKQHSNNPKIPRMNHINLIKTFLLIFIPLFSNAFAQQGSSEPERDVVDVHKVRPNVVVVIGILCSMFSLTFFILACMKFCHADVTLHTPDGVIRTRSRCSGIDKKAIESLPFFRFSSLKGSKEGLECVVCLSKFEDSEVLRLLPKCRHAFHMKCIDEWLESHSTCPLCRYKFDASDVFDFSGTNSLRYAQDEAGFNNLEIFVKREQDGPNSRSSRFSIGSSFRKFGGSPEEDGLIQYKDHHRLLDKFKHRIIVSDIVCKSRWSDVNSSDLMFLNSKMLNEVSSRRFSSSNSGKFEIDIEQVMKFKEELDRRRLYESKVGKAMDRGESSVSTSHFPRLVKDDESEGMEKRSMSDIPNVSRFRETRRSYWAASGKHERLNRVWLPMAKKTIQWFTNQDRNTFEART